MTTEYPGVEDHTRHEWPPLPELTEDEYRTGVIEERIQEPDVPAQVQP